MSAMDNILEFELKKSTKRLDVARKKQDALWNNHMELIRLAHSEGMSLAEIGRVTNVSRARIWQIVHTEEDNAEGNILHSAAAEQTI